MPLKPPRRLVYPGCIRLRRRIERPRANPHPAARRPEVHCSMNRPSPMTRNTMLPLPSAQILTLLDAPLFQGLAPDDVAPLLQTAWLATVMPGATVVAEGERGDALYL